MKKIALLIALIAIVGIANAATVVSSDISGSVTWDKANMPYHLDKQIFVLPGATLTIDAGVIVASFTPKQGSLAVCAGGKIYVNGTQQEPVIMTSAEDVATWAGSVVTRDGLGYVNGISVLGDPKTGTWRRACNEWGNLTIMGNAYISASHYKNAAVTWDESFDGGATWTTYTNTKCPGAMNKKVMEGLTPTYKGDTKVLYGGNNDNDDSGSISYLSLRYGGKVIALTNELNGLSIGGLGRDTDISYVEIMNNVDDGIEIWGGTVNLDHVSIWNIGDDSLDVDEGWRGSASYGLIVQGYSAAADQGSGIGDNCFEFDGAEDADAQPVTTTKISHFTVVGQPGTALNDGGDFGTAWRDNARAQYANCIWMNLDDDLVGYDCQDKDGADGYDGDNNDATKGKGVAANGTMGWDNHWKTSYNTWKAGAYADPRGCGIDFASLYENYMGIDPDGKLCQITNSVFYSNTKYTEYNYVSALAGSGNIGNVTSASMPIKALTRGAVVTVWDATQSRDLDIAPVTFINPLPAGDALAKNAGGFTTCNWLAGWSAASAYGMTGVAVTLPNSDVNCDGQVNLNDLSTFSAHWLQ